MAGPEVVDGDESRQDSRGPARIAHHGALGAGGLCNFIVIAANGGTMPASAAAIRAAGVAHGSQVFANSAALARPHLDFLGDVFAIPASWPVHNVFSVGDVLIAVGALVLVHTVCRSRARRGVVPGASPTSAA